jgi:hypothetical protein
LYDIHAVKLKLVELKSMLKTFGTIVAAYVIIGLAFSTAACPDL